MERSPVDLAAALPMLLPDAIAWADAQARRALARGLPLSEAGLDLARSVGVREPQRVRLDVVDEFPRPDDPLLLEAALQAGLVGAGATGLTLGYAVFLRRGHETSVRLLRHELRHVHQYESAGSIAAFLPAYLDEIVRFGYAQAPSEVDARKHEYVGA